MGTHAAWDRHGDTQDGTGTGTRKSILRIESHMGKPGMGTRKSKLRFTILLDGTQHSRVGKQGSTTWGTGKKG
ncbi:hypothetical protein SESBI_18758 [Sesbania bispinosa]|nr:hypothetical protein SESBI_18758 [Sesbania bispinosa]